MSMYVRIAGYSSGDDVYALDMHVSKINVPYYSTHLACSRGWFTEAFKEATTKLSTTGAKLAEVTQATSNVEQALADSESQLAAREAELAEVKSKLAEAQDKLANQETEIARLTTDLFHVRWRRRGEARSEWMLVWWLWLLNFIIQGV